MHEISYRFFKNLWRKFKSHYKRLMTTDTLREDRYTFCIVKVKESHYKTEVPRGFQEVKVPRLRDNSTGWW